MTTLSAVELRLYRELSRENIHSREAIVFSMRWEQFYYTTNRF